jgi:hypothetical protein
MVDLDGQPNRSRISYGAMCLRRHGGTYVAVGAYRAESPSGSVVPPAAIGAGVCPMS